MDRASVTLGAPDSSAGIMDGSVIWNSSISERSQAESTSVDVDRIGKTLSQHEAARHVQSRGRSEERGSST